MVLGISLKLTKVSLCIPVPFSNAWLQQIRTRAGGTSTRVGRSILYGSGSESNGTHHHELGNYNNSNVAPHIHFMKYPFVVGSLGGKYHLREISQNRFFQFSEMKGRQDYVAVGSTDSRHIRSRTIERHLIEHTRGYATQLILEGRGVRASFEPAWPMLTIRMGNGVKVMDVSRLVKRFAGEVKVDVPSKGDAITIHGFNREGVALIAMKMFRYVKKNQYTGKGGYLLHHPLANRKSKKG